MSLHHVTAAEFEALREGACLLLDFYADWCGPCRMLAPILEEIAAEREDVTVLKINVDEEPALAAEFGVASIPTLVVMKAGKVTRKSAGARPKAQVLALLED